MQGFCDTSGYLLDAAHGLHIELLRRELDSRVAGVDTGKFDMLGDGIELDVAVLRHGIHLYLFRALNEL